MIPQPEVRCVELVEELTEWMDCALTPARCSLLEEHLSICPDCIRYLDQVRSAIGVLRAGDPDLASAQVELGGAVLAALRERRARSLRRGEGGG